MKRLLTERLEEWKNHPRRKPLLLLGARQVGKTWLMQNFGANHYKQVAYVRFERNECLRLLFEESNSDMQELLTNIQTQVGFKIPQVRLSSSWMRFRNARRHLLH